MKHLVHGQRAFIAAWGRSEFFTIGSVEGYAAENFHMRTSAPKVGTVFDAIEKAVTRATANGHELAYTIKCGHCITDSKGYYERLLAEQESATLLIESEIVLIEGREYTVKLMGKQYSDSVHFIPLVKQDGRA